MYHVAFPISEEVSNRCFSIIDQIRSSSRAKDHVNELTDVIIAMTEQGLAYLFLDSLKHAKVSSFQIKAVQIGVNTARKGLEVVGRRALKMMTNENLVGIVNYMEQLLVFVEENSSEA